MQKINIVINTIILTCYKAVLCLIKREIINLKQTKVYTLRYLITKVTFSILTSLNFRGKKVKK